MPNAHSQTAMVYTSEIPAIYAEPLRIGTITQLLDSWFSPGETDARSSSHETRAALVQLLIHYHTLSHTSLQLFRHLTQYFWQQQEACHMTQAENVLELLLRWIILQPRGFCDAEALADVCLVFCAEASGTVFHAAIADLDRALSSQLQHHQEHALRPYSRRRNLSLDSEMAAVQQAQTAGPVYKLGLQSASTLADYLMSSSLALLKNVLNEETVRYWLRKSDAIAYSGKSPVLQSLKNVLRRNMLLEQWVRHNVQIR
jgi:hypothetical protein